MFVGWDWASTTHDVTVIDDAGNIVDRWAPEHTEMGLDATLARLTRHGRPEQLPVAIERPSGLVVDRLLAAGHPVIPIHPNAFHAARPRWGAAAAKSDPGDSFKLADYLRTDGHRLRRLRPLDAATRELQALSRLRDDHVAAKTAASNQLGALLEAHWPGAKQVFSRIGSQIALAFLDAYPTPESAARLGEARLAAFCRRHSYRGGRSPAELLGRLRSAPAAPVGLAPEVLAELVGAQVRLLRILLATIAELDRALGAGLLGHAKAGLLAPLPRIGEVSLAQVVAEVGPILDRASTVEHATAECGAAPVTKASGKSKAVTFRWAANAKARNALATFASNSRHSSPWAAKVYADARRRGKHHPHAVRILARAWLRVMWACWHNDTIYDPARHGAERRLVART
jgi:transposase